tara:strand:- start:1453 stop:1893 length:441 start_codon:yes stop_codon:yes gene_type:complete
LAKFQSGKYAPTNPDKYLGKRVPHYRSGWELAVFRMCDNHPAILGWGSETHRVPYRNPLTGKQSTYVPDLLIVYKDRKGKNHAEIVEIKPASQTLGEARTQAQKAAAIVNQAKWEAASAWAKSNGLGFRVITENQIFNRPKKGKKK